MWIILLFAFVHAENIFYGELINQDLFDTHRIVRVGDQERKVKYDPNVVPIVRLHKLKFFIRYVCFA